MGAFGRLIFAYPNTFFLSLGFAIGGIYELLYVKTGSFEKMRQTSAVRHLEEMNRKAAARERIRARAEKLE